VLKLCGESDQKMDPDRRRTGDARQRPERDPGVRTRLLAT